MYQNYKVVVNTAAGRRRYMQYLVPPILNADIVDRYDIWVNTRNMVDIEFFKSLRRNIRKLIWCGNRTELLMALRALMHFIVIAATKILFT